MPKTQLEAAPAGSANLPQLASPQRSDALLLVQALRAVAVLLVAIYHAGSIVFPEHKYFDTRPFGHWPDMGHAGVDLFFVISGFVITLAHYHDLGTPARAARFVRKRVVRIYPTYLVALAIMLVSSIELHAAHVDVTPTNVIDNALLVPDTWQHEIVPVAWTLRFEVLFYALFLLCIVERRLFLPIMIGLATLPIAGYCLAGFDNHSIVLLNAQLAQFALGVFIGRLYARQRLRHPLAVASLGAVLFIAAYGRGIVLGNAAGWGLVSVLLLGLASSLVVYGLACAEQSGRISAPPSLVWLGDASYSIYLVHLPALSLLAKAWTSAGLRNAVSGTLMLPLFVALATAAGCLFHVAVERPLVGRLSLLSR